MAYAPVAGRYAQALFDLSVEEGQVDEFGQALETTAQLIEKSEELRTVVFNPAVELADRRKVIRAIAEQFGWPTLYRNFVLLLLDRDRLRFIEDMSRAFQLRVDEHQGRTHARVTSAVELKADQIEEIRRQLGELTGKDIVLDTDVDEALIGGVVARVGSTIYDGSIRTHLTRMREAILKQV